MTAVRRLLKEFKNLKKSENEHFVVRPNEKDLLEWHFVIHNLPKDSPYFGGVYHGKFVFKPTYPFSPPAIFMMTPSMRFEVKSRLCFTMSDFHPETWANWGLEQLCIGFVSFMLDESDPTTVGGIQSTRKIRENFALKSFDFNRNSDLFRNIFPEFCDESKWSPENPGFRLKEPELAKVETKESAEEKNVSTVSTAASLPSAVSSAIFPKLENRFLFFIRLCFKSIKKRLLFLLRLLIGERT
eukprot:GHVP01000998.1.p1 GENE.GHVP01000998.1~~GHVP01000998.1.p1  ORF type:complete len:242 (+),score=37.99 GHVP01000998.1:37-762(+)